MYKAQNKLNILKIKLNAYRSSSSSDKIISL